MRLQVDEGVFIHLELVTLDETETPLTFTDSIRLDGKSREVRELGIGKLIAQE